MKKFNKLFFMLFGVMLFGCLPMLANAASVELKGEEKKGHYVDYNIFYTSGGIQDDKLNLTCYTNKPKQAECTFEGSNVSEGKGTSTALNVMAVDGKPFAHLQITNLTDSDLSDINVTVNFKNVETGDEGSATKSGIALAGNPKVTVPTTTKARSSNANLSNVTVSKGTISPAFNADITEYVIYDISDTVNSINFNWVCQDKDTCNPEISGGSAVSGNSKVTLNMGENTIQIKVSSEDYTSDKTYKFTVFRGETTYNSAKLKTLSIGEYELSPKFNKDTHDYTIQVPNALNSLATELVAETEDDKATLEITGQDNLVVGENTITIKVTCADLSETITYTIKVTRLDNQHVIVKAYKDKKVTFLNADNEKVTLDEKEFKEKYPEEWKNIESGKYKFDEDGEIIVESKEKDDDEEEPKKKSKTWIVVVLIIVGIAIIAVAGFFIFRKKPEDKDKDDENKEDKKEETTEEESTNTDLEETSDEDLLNLGESEFDADPTTMRKNLGAQRDYTIEEDIESVEHVSRRRDIDDTVDIDEALSDLMSTRQYNFEDEEE